MSDRILNEHQDGFTYYDTTAVDPGDNLLYFTCIFCVLNMIAVPIINLLLDRYERWQCEKQIGGSVGISNDKCHATLCRNQFESPIDIPIDSPDISDIESPIGVYFVDFTNTSNDETSSRADESKINFISTECSHTKSRNSTSIESAFSSVTLLASNILDANPRKKKRSRIAKNWRRQSEIELPDNYIVQTSVVNLPSSISPTKKNLPETRKVEKRRLRRFVAFERLTTLTLGDEEKMQTTMKRMMQNNSSPCISELSTSPNIKLRNGDCRKQFEPCEALPISEAKSELVDEQLNGAEVTREEQKSLMMCFGEKIIWRPHIIELAWKKLVDISLRDKEYKLIMKLLIPYRILTITESVFDNLGYALVGNYLGTTAISAYAMVDILLGMSDEFVGGIINSCMTLVPHSIGTGNNILIGQ